MKKLILLAIILLFPMLAKADEEITNTTIENTEITNQATEGVVNEETNAVINNESPVSPDAS